MWFSVQVPFLSFITADATKWTVDSTQRQSRRICPGMSRGKMSYTPSNRLKNVGPANMADPLWNPWLCPKCYNNVGKTWTIHGDAEVCRQTGDKADGDDVIGCSNSTQLSSVWTVAGSALSLVDDLLPSAGQRQIHTAVQFYNAIGSIPAISLHFFLFPFVFVVRFFLLIQT